MTETFCNLQSDLLFLSLAYDRKETNEQFYVMGRRQEVTA